MLVIVEVVTDPEAAADDLVVRGQIGRSEIVRQRGKGTFQVSETDEIGGDRDRAMRSLAMFEEQRSATGLRHYLRVDFDPDWSKQDQAARAALAEVKPPRDRWAVDAVNAFKREYHGPGWDLPNPIGGRWTKTNARNFRDGALMLANAVAGLHVSDGEMAHSTLLRTTATLGWNGDAAREDAPIRDELWLTYSLGRILRECGEGRLDELVAAIERGGAGNN